MNAAAFQTYIVRWYLLYGRHELPWRQTSDPYAILVSELMLQQTQVERVIPKFLAFLKRFPTVASLSKAELSEVLIFWQGLGYNRRAKYLWETARSVNLAGGQFPRTEKGLRALPGIGPYTASAVAAFSYNLPVLMIETNIRTVFLYHFFPNQEQVTDKDILLLIEASLDTANPREWYWALMDYGSHLKKIFPNPSRRSQQYNKQSTFKGSSRQVRGEILRMLSTAKSMSQLQIGQRLTSNKIYLLPALQSLVHDGLIHDRAGIYHLGKEHS